MLKKLAGIIAGSNNNNSNNNNNNLIIIYCYLPGSEGEGAGVVDLLTLLLWAPVATIPWVRLEVPEPCRGCSLFSASTSSPTQSAKTTSHPPPISVNCTALLAIYQKIRLCRRFLLVLYLCLCVCVMATSTGKNEKNMANGPPFLSARLGRSQMHHSEIGNATFLGMKSSV